MLTPLARAEDQPQIKLSGTNDPSPDLSNSGSGSTDANTDYAVSSDGLHYLSPSDASLLKELFVAHDLDLDIGSLLELSLLDIERLVLQAENSTTTRQAINSVNSNSDSVSSQQSVALSNSGATREVLRIGSSAEQAKSRLWRSKWLHPVGSVIHSPENTSEREITQGNFTVTLVAPPGFVELDKQLPNGVDLYMDGSRLGFVDVTTYADSFIFEDPESVLQLLGRTKNRAILISQLSGSLDSNEDFVCTDNKPRGDCGTIAPEALSENTIAAIYDRMSNRIDLFIGDEFLLAEDETQILEVTQATDSLVAHGFALVSDTDSEQEQLDAALRARYGYGAGNISTQFDYNSRSNRKRLLDLKLTHFFPNHELLVGSYDLNTGGAQSNTRILGSSISSSTITHIGVAAAFGSRISVYLDRTSTVQLAIDDRVYSGSQYEAGEHDIDTTALPNGTHEVEVRIVDPVTGPRTERINFTKSAFIPAPGKTNFQLSAGVPINFTQTTVFPQLSEHALLSYSLARRVGKSSSLGGGLTQLDEHTLLHSELLHFRGRQSYRFGVNLGEKNTYGAVATLRHQTDRVALSWNSEWRTSGFDTENDPILENYFRSGVSRHSLSASMPIGDGVLGLRTAVSKADEEQLKRTYRHSIRYRKPLLRRRDLRATLNASYIQTDETELARLGVQLYFDRADWNHQFASTAEEHNDYGSDWINEYRAAWKSTEDNTIEWGTSFFAQTQNNGESAGAKLYADHRLYSAMAATQLNRSNEQTRQLNIASVDINLGADSQGIALGGFDIAQSGVIVSVRGEADGEPFDIVVNGSVHSSGEIGSPQFIGLQPFRTHSVYLAPRSGLSSDLDASVYEFVLYPGTVQRIDYVVVHKVLLVASFVDEDGIEIVNAVANPEGDPILIDESGILQADIVPNSRLLIRQKSKPDCSVTLPADNGLELLILDTPLICLDE